MLGFFFFFFWFLPGTAGYRNNLCKLFDCYLSKEIKDEQQPITCFGNTAEKLEPGNLRTWLGFNQRKSHKKRAELTTLWKQGCCA